MTTTSGAGRPQPTARSARDATAHDAVSVGEAVRARSAAEAANSVDVVWDEGACALVEGVTALHDGSFLLTVPLGTALADRLLRADAEGTDVGGCLGVTDLAPVAVRDRVRGRLALAGWFEVRSQGADLRCRLEPQEVLWQDCGAPTPGRRRPRPAVRVDADDYRCAECDPLAAHEAELLLALLRETRTLAFLAARAGLAGLARRGDPVRPVRLDRSGVALRLDRACGPVEVPLRFPHDATGPSLAWAGLEALARP